MRKWGNLGLFICLAIVLSGGCSSKPLSEQFWAAILAKDVPKVEKMLQSNPSLLKLKTPGGLTPLHAAVTGHSKALVELFLNKGIDVNAMGSNGETPLYSAVLLRQKEIVELLISKGAAVNAQVNGHTPLWCVANEREDTQIGKLGKEIGDILRAHGGTVY